MTLTRDERVSAQERPASPGQPAPAHLLLTRLIWAGGLVAAGALTISPPPASADTSIDVSTQLPWTASGTGTSAGTVTLTGTSPATSTLSTNYAEFDVGGHWTIISNADLQTGTISAIFSGASGATFDITNNGRITSGAQAILLSNAGDTVLTNSGTLESVGAGNYDPVNVFFANKGDLKVNNYGTIHAEVSNAFEIRNANDVHIYNGATGRIAADAQRFAVYPEYSGNFVLVNDGTITAPQSAAAAPSFYSNTATARVANNGIITGSALYYGQTDGSPGLLPSSTTLVNSATGTITVTSYLAQFDSAINNLAITNAGTMESGGIGIYTNRSGGSQGIYGAFDLQNSGTLRVSAGPAVYVNTLGSSASARIDNSGTLTANTPAGAVDILNAVSATPVVISNAQTGAVENTSSSANASAIRVNGGRIDINNAGTLASTGGRGVSLLGASGITLANTGAIRGATTGVYAANTGTAATAISSSGTIAGGTAGGIYTTENPGTPVSIDLTNGAKVSATSATAILDTNGDASVTVDSATVSGAIRLGMGDDRLTVAGTSDIGGTLGLLDGGNASNGTVTDILGTPTAATNRLTFRDTRQTLTGANLLNWLTITLDTSAVTLADGNLATGTGTNADNSLQGLVLKGGATMSSPAALAMTGDVNIGSGSAFNHARGGSITGDVTNAGLIYWQNLGQTLTINGNYVGLAGSAISLETRLADDASATDKLVVTGNTSGSSAITIRPVGGSPGGQTANGIPVVQVNGASAAGSFTLASPVQAGAYQYVLKQGSALDSNDWYLVSRYDCSLNGSCANGGDMTSGTSIYRPGVANYVAGQHINAEQGFQQLSSYHQRLGAMSYQAEDGRFTWLRPYYIQQAVDGRTRFDYDARIAGVQFGHDLWFRRSDDGGTRRAALTIDYANADGNVGDAFRPHAGLPKNTGDVDAGSVAVGGTFTWTDAKRGYLDLVGQLSSLRNRFTDNYGNASVQNGQRAALSIEAGKVVARLGNWQIEPQTQFIYMHTRYRGFEDNASRIDTYDVDALRGRLGARIFNNAPLQSARGMHLYGLVNVLHDFKTPGAIRIGSSVVAEEFSRTRGEVGGGVQYRWTKDAYTYADLRYQRSLDNKEAHGAQASIGLKVAL